MILLVNEFIGSLYDIYLCVGNLICASVTISKRFIVQIFIWGGGTKKPKRLKHTRRKCHLMCEQCLKNVPLQL
jgi:hypothetical protein